MTETAAVEQSAPHGAMPFSHVTDTKLVNMTSTTVGELALELHLKEKAELVATIAEGSRLHIEAQDAGYTVAGSQVVFASLADRNEHACTELFLRVGGAASLDALYDAAVEAWGREIGRGDHLSGRLIARAAERENVVAYLDKRLKSGARAYDVLHVVEAALPYLRQLDLESLIEFMRTQHRLTNGAAVILFGPLETWLSQHPAAAGDLHGRLREVLDASTEVLFSVCVPALARSDFDAAVDLAEEDVRSGNEARAKVGVQTLGRLLRIGLAEPPAPGADRIQALILGLADGSDPQLEYAALEVAASTMHLTRAFDQALRAKAATGDKRVLQDLATYLFLNEAQILARGDLLEWIDLAMQLGPNDAGIAQVDNALARLLKKPEFVSEVVERLASWVERHGTEGGRDKALVTAFPDTSRGIAQMPAALNEVMTNWLIAPNLARPANAASLLGVGIAPDSTQCTLHLATVDALDRQDLMLLGRRLLGYVHEPKHLLSMALSLLDTKDARDRTFGLVDELLVNQIGYDYPGTTLKAIRRAIDGTADSSARELLEGFAVRIEAPFLQLEALPHIGEVRIRGDLQRQITLLRSRQMARATRNAERSSILSQIAMHIPIKAGIRTFSREADRVLPPIELKRHSFVAELPRREVLDPIGNSIRLAGFRASRRRKE
jgi:hypothetical protein